MIVDSYRFLPRSFRPLYKGREPFPGEDAPVWASFEKRLATSRIALLSSAALLKGSQPSFDTEHEQDNPEWGDPSWGAIPAGAEATKIAVATCISMTRTSSPTPRSPGPPACSRS